MCFFIACIFPELCEDPTYVQGGVNLLHWEQIPTNLGAVTTPICELPVPVRQESSPSVSLGCDSGGGQDSGILRGGGEPLPGSLMALVEFISQGPLPAPQLRLPELARKVSPSPAQEPYQGMTCHLCCVLLVRSESLNPLPKPLTPDRRGPPQNVQSFPACSKTIPEHRPTY